MAFSGNNVHCRGIKVLITNNDKEPKDLSVKNGERAGSWCSYQKRERGEKSKRVTGSSRKRRKPSSPVSDDGCVSDDIEVSSLGSPPSHKDISSPRVSPLSPGTYFPSGYVSCGWCQKIVKSEEINFKAVNGDKSFCSEVCFTQCRRASFKRKKTCDWCKHVRHTVNYVDFQDGDHQLQFCSGKCLNQYKMNIFCRETQAHLELHPHLQGSETTKATKTPTSTTLITPDMWLRDCESDSSLSASPSPSPPPKSRPLSPTTPPCVPSPLIEIKVSAPPTPPPGPRATPPASSADYGINRRVRKEILSRKKKKTLEKESENAAKRPENPAPTVAPPPAGPPPGHFFNFNPHLGGPETGGMHRPPFNPTLLPPMFPPFPRPPLRLPPPLLPINRPFAPPPSAPTSQSLLPPPTVLIPYPVALPIPIPVPVPVPIPIPLEVFATLRQKEEKNSSQPSESLERVQVKTEPVSPTSSPVPEWQEAAVKPVVPEKRSHPSRDSLEKQKTVSTSCI